MAVAVVDVRVESSAAVRNLRQLDQASKNSEASISALTGKVAGLAASLAAGFALSRIVSDVKELDRNIRRLGTVGVDVAKINPALSKLSDNLGGVASKAELAAASYQAASAGFSDTAGNIQILNAATKAAVGGLADTQAVTEVLVKTLNAYGMSGSEAFKVTDSISKAVELGNQEWSDYTSQLGRVASTAALAGVSLDEMNAFIASATKNGATAEVAFTGLSAVLTQLLQPTKESQDAAAKLGIQWNLMGLQTKGLGGLMRELAIAIDKDKEAAARMVGPTEAMRGAFAAASKDGSDFRMILGEIGNATGKTNADFQTMKGSVENTLKALDTSFKNLSEALLKAFGPTVVITLQDLTKGVNGFASAMNAIPQPVMNATSEVIKLGIQMALLYKAIQGVIALKAGVAAMFATTATGAAAAGGAAAAATPQVTTLGTALRGLTALGAIAVAINIAIYGFTEFMTLTSELDRLRGLRNQPGGPAGSFGGSATAEQKAVQRRVLQQIAEERKKRLPPVPGILGRNPYLMKQEDILNERERSARAILALPTRAESKPKPIPTGGGVVTGTGTGTGTKAKTASKDAEQTRADMLRESSLQLKLAQAQYELEGRILSARQDGYQPLVLAREAQAKLLQITYEANKVAADKTLPAARKENELAVLKIQAQTVARQLAFDVLTYEQERVKAAAGAMQQLQDELDLQQAKLNGNEAEVMLNQQIRDLKAQYPALNEADIRTTLQKTQALKQQLSAAEELKALYSDIGMSIKSGVVDAIQGAIDGTKSLQQVAVDLLNSIANKLLDVAVNMALFGTMSGTGTGGGLLGGLFKARAMGGSVRAGQPYLVGERGPELFMPGRSGGIAPTGSFGGAGINVTVNVTTGGSSVQGDQAEGKQLGLAISAAVQSELIKQKRPGGLLA